MSGFTSSGKSVMIREEKRLGRSPQFSLTFPKKLNGIIHPDEFQQSITNINRAGEMILREKILLFSLFLCSLLGFLAFITGISIIWLSIPTLWIPLMTGGFLLFLSFLTTAIFVSSRIYRSCDTRLDKAIEAESKKYSTRSPVPTKWKLDMTIYTRRVSTIAAPTDIQYFLLIDIGEKAELTTERQSLTKKPSLSRSASEIDRPASSSSQMSPILSSSDKTLHLEDRTTVRFSV